MPAPVVESWSTASSDTVTSGLTVPMPSGTVAGDLLLAFAQTFNSDALITGMTGWTQCPLSDGNMKLAWTVATGSDSPLSLTWPGQVSRCGASVFRISGAHSSSPVDVYSVPAFVGGGGTTIAIGSVTTTGPDRLLLALGFSVDPNDPPRSLTGWTQAGAVLHATTGTGVEQTLSQGQGARWLAQKSASAAIASAGATPATVMQLSGTLSYTVGARIAIAPAAAGAGAITGTLAASVSPSVAELAGTYTEVFTGTLAASPAPATGDLAGTFTAAPVTGALLADTAAATVALAGSVEGDVAVITGSLAAELAAVVADLSGTTPGATSTPGPGRVRVGSGQNLTVDTPPARPAHLVAVPHRIVAEQLPAPTLKKGRPL